MIKKNVFLLLTVGISILIILTFILIFTKNLNNSDINTSLSSTSQISEINTRNNNVSSFVQSTSSETSSVVPTGGSIISNSTPDTSSQTSSSTSSPSTITPYYINGILIVNKTYAIPPNFASKADDEALGAYNKMKEDMAKEGMNIVIASGFRPNSNQTTIYNKYVKANGKAVADTFSARPGHSEHETGLSFDIGRSDGLYRIEARFATTDEAKWLAVNSYKYGFILRYPEGKENITGYMYEPWHFRYIGVDNATLIFNSKLCIEEYFNITSVYSY